MAVSDMIKKAGRGVLVAAALAAGTATTMAPEPAHAISPGWAAGIGVGSFALGAALASRPYGYYPYGAYYAPPPAYYYPPAPAYAPRSCWDPYYRRYYAC